MTLRWQPIATTQGIAAWTAGGYLIVPEGRHGPTTAPAYTLHVPASNGRQLVRWHTRATLAEVKRDAREHRRRRR